ncbi:hypothetical protein IMG5_133990 [Ichthyophthirius multifiliis]|uniref:tRNA (guanine(26)-N(2))-dimethyltransferase n=1 Tax=Ichthyophthirius multifiliis TaxID=5932 RepID=G0QWP1_ICHMU|nr:hypothetical protein IMG5_133990 [Ichthyophthirius multifiliis]EGR30356.1 hypothetical protein IMG5_133990 [Ichthyophthirius multifiliis]|eukprot:XP_004031943.1 hypothetical protein IMG5_133990 [Ichthyophthirius multifiliis]
MQKQNIITEGLAQIQKSYTVVENGKTFQSEVFYNPVQIFNRDLTILVIKLFTNYLKEQYKEKFIGVNILDALSASGLRAIRYLKELQDVQKVTANDISEASHRLMMDNFLLNNLDLKKIEMTKQDALELMYIKRFTTQNYDDRFHVIDIDPYGTAAPFIDAAIQASLDDTLLCVTSTDSRILCGPDTQKCYYLYGSSRAKVTAYQENAIRILLYTINNVANKYGKSIRPLICYLTEFYVRVFLLVKTSKQECGKSLLKHGYAYYCELCSNYSYQTFGKQQTKNENKCVPAKVQIEQNVCDQCGEQFIINGPIWLDQLNDYDFVKKASSFLEQDEEGLNLATKKKIQGMLYGIEQEFEKQVHKIPLGFHMEHISKLMKCPVPNKKAIFSALQSLGYQIEQSYINHQIFKTNATSQVFFDIIRSWVIHNYNFLVLFLKKEINLNQKKKKKSKQTNEEEYFRHFEKEQPNYKLIIKTTNCNPNFNINIQFNNKFTKWPQNPKNWGPGKKAVVKKALDQNDQNIQEENIHLMNK